MKEIINELKYFNKDFPRKALVDAVNKKEEITEILLQKLDEIIVSPEIVTGNKDYMLHFYSVYLLAQFKEKRAFKRIISLISFTPDEVEFIFGDIITEGLPSILYSTFDGNLSLLQAVIEDPLLNIYVRGTALDVYGKLYSDGVISKEEGIAYLRGLIYDNYQDEDSDIATDISSVVYKNHIFELVDDIQHLYDQNRIDLYITGEYDNFIDYIYSYKFERSRVRYIDDVIEELNCWACFEQKEDKEEKSRNRQKMLEELIKLEEELEKPDKIGRNDPCPCGSGKKYKKCCLNKESSVEVEFIEGFSESVREQEKWLKHYPIEDEKTQDDKVRITDIYDNESISIDKLAYLALHHRAIPIWVDRDNTKEEMIKISYLLKAYEKFLLKCKEENISSFDEYDKKYKIHYKSKEWIEELNDLICINNLEYEYEDVLKSIDEKFSKFS